MGTRSWDSTDFTTYASTSSVNRTKAVHEVFTARGMHANLDPSGFTTRESRNSPANPKSTPIILGLDVTGSMGRIAREIAVDGLGTLITEILARKPVTDPHIMFMGIGDVYSDRAPLQASQFETDIRMLEQLTQIYVEGGGGGNNSESYTAAWHFAQFHTSCDAFEKDARKGYLFTFGDECVPPDLSENSLEKIYGRGQETSVSNALLLQMLAPKYHVFHLMLEQGSFMAQSPAEVKDSWQALLGQRAVPVSDYKALGEIITSLIQITEGDAPEDVIKSWSGKTSVAVAHATRGVATQANSGAASVTRL